MKNIAILSTLQILIALAANANAYAISQWEDIIPMSEETAIELINEKAADFTYRDSDSGTVCGGETAMYQLADYYTTEDYDGLVHHKMAVRFVVTVPVDFCASETVKVCQTTFQATSETDVKMGVWKCAGDEKVAQK